MIYMNYGFMAYIDYLGNGSIKQLTNINILNKYIYIINCYQYHIYFSIN